MKPGSKVKVHYKGTLNDDTVFDSSEGRGPLEFTIGENQVIPGFENGVKDMELNEEKTIKINPKDASQCFWLFQVGLLLLFSLRFSCG